MRPCYRWCSAAPLAQPCRGFPAPRRPSLPFGHAAGTRGPPWNCQGLAVSLREGTLHLEVAAEQEDAPRPPCCDWSRCGCTGSSLDSRRGPGCGLSVEYQLCRCRGKIGVTEHRLPACPRAAAGYWPLAPFRQHTSSSSACRPGPATPRCRWPSPAIPRPGYNFVDLYDVSIRWGQGPLRHALGPNLLLWAISAPPTIAGGVPPGWGTWIRRPDKMDFVPANAAVPIDLRIGPGQGFILAAPDVPIEPGFAYRVSFRARGKADLAFGVHALENVNSYPLRVGRPAPSRCSGRCRLDQVSISLVRRIPVRGQRSVVHRHQFADGAVVGRHRVAADRAVRVAGIQNLK